LLRFALDRGGQSILPPQQKIYLIKSIDYSWYLWNQTVAKFHFFKGHCEPISSTLILAELLLKSEFGEHPLAQEVYPPKTTKGANNLMLLENDTSWTGKLLKYEGKEYKSFANWEEFGVHFTDLLVFRKNEIHPYLYKNLLGNEYNKEKIELVTNYCLEDFEIGAPEERRNEDRSSKTREASS